jgi:hypothetical protein
MEVVVVHGQRIRGLPFLRKVVKRYESVVQLVCVSGEC